MVSELSHSQIVEEEEEDGQNGQSNGKQAASEGFLKV